MEKTETEMMAVRGRDYTLKAVHEGPETHEDKGACIQDISNDGKRDSCSSNGAEAP
jgi:hypothetical protein